MKAERGDNDWFAPDRTPLGVGAWVMLVLLGALLQWHLVFMPLGADQGIYATTAMKMLEGKALYRDVWDMKSPGIFFLYLLPLLGGGGKTWLIHSQHVVLHTIAAAALLRAGRLFVGRAFGWAAAALYLAIGAAWATPMTMGQPDDWMLPFLLWGFMELYECMAPEVLIGMGIRQALTAGVLMGVVLVLRSPMLAAVALAPTIWLARLVPGADGRVGDWPSRQRLGWCLAAYVGGGLIVGVLTLSYFVATGSLADFYYAQFVWVRNYMTTELRNQPLTVSWALAFAIRRWFEFFQHDLLLLLWPAPAGVAYLVWRRVDGRAPLRPLVAWAIGLGLSSTSYWIQLKFFGYHHWFVVPFVALGLAVPAMLLVRGGMGLLTFSGRTSVWWRYGLRGVVVGGVWGLWALMANNPTTLHDLFQRQTKCVRWLRGKMSDRRFIGPFRFAHFYFPYEDRLLADLIQRRHRHDGPPRVFVYGFRPQLYYALGISGPSRFCYNLPLRADWSPPEWAAALEGEVMATPPDFVLLGYTDYYPWVTGNPLTSSETMPTWLRRMLDDEFVLVWEMSNFNLYERRTADYTPRRFRSLRPPEFYIDPGVVPHQVLPGDDQEAAETPEPLDESPAGS